MKEVQKVSSDLKHHSSIVSADTSASTASSDTLHSAKTRFAERRTVESLNAFA